MHIPSALLWVAKAIWFVLPAYVANGAPVILARILPRRHPIDGGATFIDGKRVLGDSKTVEGFLFGVFAGVVTGLVESVVTGFEAVVRGFVMGVGAMIGDCLGSFIKRRLGLRPGARAPLLDQLPFLLIALLLAYAAHVYWIDVWQTVFLIVLTPALHYLTNVAAYFMKLKSVPW